MDPFEKTLETFLVVERLLQHLVIGAVTFGTPIFGYVFPDHNYTSGFVFSSESRACFPEPHRVMRSKAQTDPVLSLIL
ncbi:hypothetical protein AGR4C_pa60034 [Agrobacterium tumefaciens str. Kerr 14]|uniref:Uncharacterized protein n=1 Tax=Agrobacterium tumefaciens str. Kerr 14 TaxID=1183424 RepID=A0A1S7SBK2_AGRTU|nr:hypothetical protein AGR4C_pa60034 [Agrobacterium tumefaciens str. Kerr 14]